MRPSDLSWYFHFWAVAKPVLPGLLRRVIPWRTRLAQTPTSLRSRLQCIRSLLYELLEALRQHRRLASFVSAVYGFGWLLQIMNSS